MTYSHQPYIGSSADTHSLRYPIISEDSPATTAVSCSSDMDIDSQSEDGLTSLSDSTYEIVSQSSFNTSDDGSHGDGDDSIVSFGIATPEGGSSVDGDDYAFPQRLTSAQVPPPPGETDQTRSGQQSSTCQIGSSPNQSTLSSGTTTQFHDDWITFKEPIASVASGLVDVTQSYPSKDTQDPSFCTTVKTEKALANHIFRLDGPFRVLFCATSTEAHLKEPILEKIGQALHVSVAVSKTRQISSKEKLNIIPISAFGNDGTAPDVMLLPSTGLQLEVEDCSAPLLDHHTDTDMRCLQSTLPYLPKNTACQSSQTPDLAIFVHGSLSQDFASLMSDLARSEGMKRNGIPVIDICGDLPDYVPSASASARIMQDLAQLRYKPSKGRAVHAAYEMKGSSENEKIKFATPIDHQTFQQMDPTELNRNIAAITKGDSVLNFEDAQWFILSMVRSLWLKVLLMYAFLQRLWSSFFSQATEAVSFVHANVTKPHSRQVRAYIFRLRKDIVAGLVVGLFICSALWLQQRGASFKMTRPSTVTKVSIATATTNVGNTRPTQLQTLPAPVAVPLISAPHYSQKISALTPGNKETSLSIVPTLSRPSTNLVSKIAPEFKLLEAQDGRLFLQSTKPFPRKWKPSEFFVHAFQQGRPLGITFSKIRDSTFELYLERSHSCAPVLVTVWPTEAQTASQTFQLTRPCSRMLSPDNMAKAFADIRSWIWVSVPRWRDAIYQHAVDLSSETAKQMNNSYNEWSPRVLPWVRVSLERVRRFPEELEEARLAFNAIADERLELLEYRINERAELIMHHFGERFLHAKLTIKDRYEALRLQAWRCYGDVVSNLFRKKHFSRTASAPVKIARTRAVLFKNRIFAKRTVMWQWVVGSQERFRGFAERCRERHKERQRERHLERLVRRSHKCKKRIGRR